MEITNHRLLQFCRWLLLLICLSGGGFLLLGGKSRGFGILLLLIAFWFVLDNPLDSLENLEGSCPFCGHKVQTRRGLSFRCPACAEKTVIVDSEISYFEDIRTLSDLYPRSFHAKKYPRYWASSSASLRRLILGSSISFMGRVQAPSADRCGIYWPLIRALLVSMMRRPSPVAGEPRWRS